MSLFLSQIKKLEVTETHESEMKQMKKCLASLEALLSDIKHGE